MKKNLLTKSLLAMFLTLPLAACEPEGPAERAGEQLDEAADSIGDAARDVRDEAEDFADDVNESIEDARQ